MVYYRFKNKLILSCSPHHTETSSTAYSNDAAEDWHFQPLLECKTESLLSSICIIVCIDSLFTVNIQIHYLFFKDIYKSSPPTLRKTLGVKRVVSYAHALVHVLISTNWVTVIQLALDVSK